MTTSKKIPVLLALVGLMGALTACSGDDAAVSSSPTGGLALVMGAHANAPAPKLPAGVLELLDQAGLQQSQIAVVTNEGEPTVAVDTSFVSTAANDQARQQERVKNEKKVLAAAQGLTATTPESDLLAAITSASRTIADAQGEKTIAVVDSGLTTVAPLQFQSAGVLSADPADVAAFVKDSGNLPDLAGFRVVLSGLGDTAPPQERLTTAQQKNLQAIWTALLTEAGAEVEILQDPQTSAALDSVPEVTPVPIEEPDSVTAPTVAPQQTATVTLSQDLVAFAPDSDEYRDAASATAVLEPLAQQIVEQGLTVHLTGSTASAGTAAGRQKLSLLRADAVKQSLVALGVPESSITTTGVGSDWPGYVQDRDAAGTLLPGPAAQNRKVTMELSHS